MEAKFGCGMFVHSCRWQQGRRIKATLGVAHAASPNTLNFHSYQSASPVRRESPFPVSAIVT